MRYAIVGTGARHQMFREAITQDHAGRCELVALCDTNASRLALSASKVERRGGNGVATYRAAEFGGMLAEQRPDAVVVTTPDFTHHLYIVEALRAGCDVITEKPMTTSLEGLKAILDAQRQTGRKVMVTLNYRYSPARTQLKKMLAESVIGEVTAIDFSWHLDRVHGADYFRRWHRYKERSGGLLVHKAAHHFDLLNWWAASHPVSVNAHGKRSFYRPEMAESLGLSRHGERCHTCQVAGRCDFRMDLADDPKLRELYLDAEEEDGYWRDRCVFADDITIEDTMQVQLGYANGVSCNYTLCAYSPWEGFEIRFHGTKGELTHRHVEVHGVFGSERQRPAEGGVRTQLQLAGGVAQDIEVWTGAGEHGGADPIMLGYLFDPTNMPADAYGRGSDHVDGAWSTLVGIAANQSMAAGERVDLGELLTKACIEL